MKQITEQELNAVSGGVAGTSNSTPEEREAWQNLMDKINEFFNQKPSRAPEAWTGW